MLKILNIGGGGFLGGALLDCIGFEFSYIVYDSFLYGQFPLQHPCLRVLKADVRSQDVLSMALNDTDVVIFSLSLETDDQEQRKILVDAANFVRQKFKKRIIVCSDYSVYHNNSGISLENSRIDDSFVWSEIERIFKDETILRFGTFYGQSDIKYRLRNDLIINKFCVSAYFNDSFNCPINCFLPLIHVKDAAKYIKKIIETGVSGVFNVAASHSNMSDIGLFVAEQFNSNFKRVVLPTDLKYFLDCSRIRDKINIEPFLSVEYGVFKIKDTLYNWNDVVYDDIKYNNYEFYRNYKQQGKQ